MSTIAEALPYTVMFAALMLAWHNANRAKRHNKSARRWAGACHAYLTHITHQAASAAASEANAARSEASCETWVGLRQLIDLKTARGAKDVIEVGDAPATLPFAGPTTALPTLRLFDPTARVDESRPAN